MELFVCPAGEEVVEDEQGELEIPVVRQERPPRHDHKMEGRQAPCD